MCRRSSCARSSRISAALRKISSVICNARRASGFGWHLTTDCLASLWDGLGRGERGYRGSAWENNILPSDPRSHSSRFSPLRRRDPGCHPAAVATSRPPPALWRRRLAGEASKKISRISRFRKIILDTYPYFPVEPSATTSPDVSTPKAFGAETAIQRHLENPFEARSRYRRTAARIRKPRTF